MAIYGSGFKVNKDNLSMRNERITYFEYVENNGKNVSNDNALALKKASLADLEFNRMNNRDEVTRTNLLRWTISMMVIFWVMMMLVNFL